ncbi:MAG: hypothetical protein ACLUJV_02405 [Blautia producta]
MIATIVNWDKDLALPLSETFVLQRARKGIRLSEIKSILEICCQGFILENLLKMQSMVPILKKTK